MTIETLPGLFSVCRVRSLPETEDWPEYTFAARTDQEFSLVCPSSHAPLDALERDDGWRGFRVRGPLDFSLVGVLSELSGVLAQNGIPIFAVSTYLTDYILVRETHFASALEALARAGHTVI